MGGVVFEAFRLALIQKILKDDKYKMDPLVSLYYFAPCCAGMICMMGVALEWKEIRWEDVGAVGAGVWILNGAVAMGLNVAGVLLVTKISDTIPAANFADLCNIDWQNIFPRPDTLRRAQKHHHYRRLDDHLGHGGNTNAVVRQWHRNGGTGIL